MPSQSLTRTPTKTDYYQRKDTANHTPINYHKAREIKKARHVLSEFEGERFEGRKKPPHETGTINPPQLFDTTRQKLSRAEASILGMVNETKGDEKTSKGKYKRKKHKWMTKDGQELQGSRFSINYDDFNSPNISSDVISPTPDLEEYVPENLGQASQNTGATTDSLSGTHNRLKEYYVKNGNFVSAKEFYESNSCENTVRKETSSAPSSNPAASRMSISTVECTDSVLGVTVKLHGHPVEQTVDAQAISDMCATENRRVTDDRQMIDNRPTVDNGDSTSESTEGPELPPRIYPPEIFELDQHTILENAPNHCSNSLKKDEASMVIKEENRAENSAENPITDIDNLIASDYSFPPPPDHL